MNFALDGSMEPCPACGGLGDRSAFAWTVATEELLGEEPPAPPWETPERWWVRS